MSDLQTAFYIVGLVFMGLMLLLTLIGVAAVLVIRAKVNAIHRRVETKLEHAVEWAERGSAVLGTIKKAARSRR